MILIFVLFPLLLAFIIGIGVCCYLLWRNYRTYTFKKELLNMASESACKAIDECKFDEWKKSYDVLDKHSYKSMLFSTKPLKLKYWFTEQEIKILKGGSDGN